jgi:hypothetical protein
LAFSATIATPGVASAYPASQLFDIWNLTAGDLVVEGYDQFLPAFGRKSQQQTGLPPAGSTTFPTGKNLQLTMDNTKGLTVYLSGRYGAQKWAINMGYDTGTAQINCNVKSAANEAACGNYIGHNVSIVADGPNKRIDVPEGDTQKQATMFNDLCVGPYADALKINCDVSEMNRDSIYGDWTLPADFQKVTAGAGGGTHKSYEVNWRSETTTTMSLTASATPPFLAKIGASIEAKYTTSTTKAREVKQSVLLDIPAGKTGWICASLPKWHYVGKLTVYAGNTAWYMPGVTVVTPREGGSAGDTWFTDTRLDDVPDPCSSFPRNNPSSKPRGDAPKTIPAVKVSDFKVPIF